MNKLLLTATLLLFSTLCRAQTPLIFSEVVPAKDSASKDALYQRARTWFTMHFNSANAVIQQEDKATGTIIGKGLYNFQSRNFFGSAAVIGIVRYTVSITVKDGRYKYEITGFTHESTARIDRPLSAGLLTTAEEFPYHHAAGAGGWSNKLWIELKEKSTDAARQISASLKVAMAEATTAQKDDW